MREVMNFGRERPYIEISVYSGSDGLLATGSAHPVIRCGDDPITFCNRNQCFFRVQEKNALLKMYMIVYMLYTKAMVAVAPRTVAELEIREFRISFSADVAFMVVMFPVVLAPGFPRRPLEVNSLVRRARNGRPKVSHHIVAAYQEKVQQRDDRQQRESVIADYQV